MKLKCLLLTFLLSPLDFGRGDLDARSVSVNDTRPDPGDLITVSWTAVNRTGDYIGSSTQAVVLSTDTTIGDGDDVRLGTEGLGPLGGLLPDTSPEIKTVRLPTNLVRGRSYWIGVIADYNDRRDESNESNNASGAVRITIRSIDLYASSLSINDNNPDLGDLVTVSWTANSRDDTPIGDSQQAVVLSTDATSTRDDQFLEREYLGPLGGALSASTRELRTITIPENLNPGTTYLNLLIEMDSDYTSLFNLTEDVRFTAYYNDTLSLVGSNLIGNMILNVGSSENSICHGTFPMRLANTFSISKRRSGFEALGMKLEVSGLAMAKPSWFATPSPSF
jgi:hypothetical protein